MDTAIEVDPKLVALAKFLEVEPDDLTERDYDHYGLTVYELGSKEYAIGTDDEATSAARDEIKGSLWAFNASFILSECDLPMELEDGIRAAQEKQCESANDWLEGLIEKSCGLEEFADSAISADGRGHFLNTYDGEENEEGEYFIYRIN